jgi:signal transduction histidine kinase/outer membrane protein assembly factor BamB
MEKTSSEENFENKKQSATFSIFHFPFSIFHFPFFLFFTFYFLLVLPPNIFPQSEPTIKEDIFQSSLNLHQWGTISSFNGLPSERINAIAQTPDGILWFATDNGLARFDGRRVQTNLSAGLSSMRILSLQTDSDGTLWVGTEKGAFYYTDNFFQPIQETENYSVNSIFIDGDSVYLGDPNGTIFKTEFQNNSAKSKIILKSSLPVKSLVKKDNQLLIGTLNKGLLKTETENAEPSIVRSRPFFINVLAKTSEQNLWLGATSSNEGSGLFFSEKLPEIRVVGEDLGTVNSIAFGENKDVWVGTETRGAYRFEGQDFRKRFTFENTSGGLRSNKILSTFVDREGVIWFGTDKGVSRYDPKSPSNERISEDVQSNFVRKLFQTQDGKAYAGTNRGLFVFDENTNIWKLVNGFQSRTIYAVSSMEDENILIGTRSGLFKQNTSSKIKPQIQIIGDEIVRAIEKFQNAIYFSSFGKGVKKIENGRSKLIYKSNVISLYNEENKTLWLGTINEGVFVFDGKKAAAVKELDELKNTAIRTITGNQSDGIWFATDKGLYLFKDGELQIVLAEQNVRDVFVQHDENRHIRVWCAAETGLFNLVFSENFGWIKSRIDIEQGLSSQNIFAVLPLNKNSFLIGTNRGIIRYETSEIKPILVATRVLSQKIHQPSELKTGINLNYPQNSLSVEVAAISSRTFSEQFQYSFLLFDGNNEIIYKKFSDDGQFLMDELTPAKYRVEVRAYDKNLLASEPLIFNFTVEQAPFPLIPTILSILLLIVVAALIWAILSQRKSFQTSKELVYANKELNNARLNLANEAERERHRISQDLHDQTLADLRHLILMADETDTEKAVEFRTEIENVSEEIRRICEDLSPSVLENIGFAAALEWALGNSIEQVSHDDRFKYEFISDENLEKHLNLSRSEQIQIYRIAQEVLSNIARHSNATEIKMTAQINKSNKFLLKIKDNGKSFDPNRTKKGRGLANINARARLIEAEVKWDKMANGGMTFTLRK